jgi:archaellum component FlaF (FlaF/FlaG flagellin family)
MLHSQQTEVWKAMRKSYSIVAVFIVMALASSALGTEYQTVDAYKNCIGVRSLNAAYTSNLMPGDTYTVTVDGNARASMYEDSDYDGVFLYYYDGTAPVHPKMVVVNKEEEHTFVASGSDFYAFLVDKSMKDTADNSGSMTVTITGEPGFREELIVDALFNCIGLFEFGAAKKYLTGGNTYSTTVSGDAATNGDPTGYFDGVCLFYRHISRPYHPILDVLEVGDERLITPHSTGWVFCFLLDETVDAMGNNSGSMLLSFEEETAVEESSWGSVKAMYR